MVQRQNPNRRKNKAQPADADLLIKAARMVGTALGTISASVRGSRTEAEPKVSKAPESTRSGSRKATPAKKAPRKAKRKAAPAKDKTRASRVRKASGR